MTITHGHSLHVLKSLLEDAARFFQFAQQQVRDPEAQAAFGTAAAVRSLLVDDLRAADASATASAPVELPETVGYASLHRRFDPQHPELLAAELLAREKLMQQLLDRVFRESANFRIRRLLQNCVKLFQRDALIWSRLQRRQRTRAA